MLRRAPYERDPPTRLYTVEIAAETSVHHSLYEGRQTIRGVVCLKAL